ncbi:MAG TPA: hypothetical protein DCL38_00965 [Lachnospiraceae bacterium]|nr:hypothetical protein [Lachnospiraceae bacterium]
MKGLVKFLAAFAAAAMVVVVPVKADALDDAANAYKAQIDGWVARAKADKANQEATFAKQREALANALAGYAKRAETDYNNQLALEQKQQAAWADQLAGYLKRVEIDQKNYNTSFLNEIYKGSVENLRIKKQLCGSIQDLTKVNPSFEAGVEAAKEAVACAEVDKDAAKAAYEASK